jgi:nucleoside 2-deoxyribosyltransferase
VSTAQNEAEPGQCPLCKHEVPVRTFFPAGDGRFTVFHCPRCGEFGADKQCILALRDSGPDPLLSGVARQMAEAGETLRLTYTNLAEARKLAPATIGDKTRRLLRAIVKNSQYPGQSVELVRQRDYPLVFGNNGDELDFFLDHLESLHWLKKDADPADISCTVTARGWTEFEKDKSANIESEKAFVAMWFDPGMAAAYEHAIKPAIEEDAGFKSIRVDDVEHTGKIDDRIIAEIRESRFLVADFTGHRGGVYFEAGYAMGMGLPVIWACKAAEMNNAHFDTRQYNHIVWNDPGELREKLALRIRATIGTAPSKRGQ